MGKRHEIQNRIKTSVVNDKAVKVQTKTNKCLYYFYENLFFKNNAYISRQNVLQYLQVKSFPKLNDDQCALCGNDIAE